MHVVTTDNGLVAVNEAFARSLASGKSYETLGYTQTLQFDTQVLEVPFVKWKDFEGHSPCPEDLPIRFMRPFPPGESVRFAVVRTIGSDPVSLVSSQSPTSRALFWPLFLKCNTADTEDIQKEPDTRTIECVVIGDEYGLLVQTKDGVSKRVGLVRFKCEFLMNGRMRSDEALDEKWNWCYEVKKVDWGNYFPSSVRTVYLG